MSLDEFLRCRLGQEVRTDAHGLGVISGKLVKQHGMVRVIVNHGQRIAAQGGQPVPVVMSYPLAEVEIVDGR